MIYTHMYLHRILKIPKWKIKNNILLQASTQQLQINKTRSPGNWREINSKSNLIWFDLIWWLLSNLEPFSGDQREESNTACGAWIRAVMIESSGREVPTARPSATRYTIRRALFGHSPSIRLTIRRSNDSGRLHSTLFELRRTQFASH